MDIRVDYEPAQYGDIKCLANPPINIDTSVTTLFLAECHFFVRLSNGLAVRCQSLCVHWSASVYLPGDLCGEFHVACGLVCALACASIYGASSLVYAAGMCLGAPASVCLESFVLLNMYGFSAYRLSVSLASCFPSFPGFKAQTSQGITRFP